MIRKNKLILISAGVIIGFLAAAIYFPAAKIKTAAAQSTDVNSTDAIAVRIVPNPNHYSITRWYADQGFQGSPQSLVVDGYDAIRDGRTVYVNAAKVDLTTTPPTIYTNIYLISYNQDPAPKTVDILGQIISHWKFNDNLKESANAAPSCSISSLSCALDSDCGADQFCSSSAAASSSCQLKTTKNCLVDTDCPTNFFCDSIKAKVVRDIKRVGQLEELKEALFNFKKTNLHYPLLTAGTYLTSNSLSVWPSWSQVLLSDLAVSQNFLDPINRLGACPGYNLKTCWDEIAKKFVSSSVPLTLPAGSYALAYATDANGAKYNLCAVLETRDSALQYHFSPNDPSSSNCVMTTGIISGGTATNTPPQLVDASLTGGANQEFDGYIKVIDAESNPLTWSLNTSNTNWIAAGWSAAPILQSTTNSNQKKVYAAHAGNPGTYNTTLTVTDGQGGILSTSTPIKIVTPGPLIKAEDEEYVLDPTVPFKYSFSFAGKNISNPAANTASITKISGDNSFDAFNFAGLTKTLTVIGENEYQITAAGTIPTSNKFPQDTDFNYRLTVTDKYSNTSTKDFSLKFIATNPVLNFNCPDAVRINNDYGCVIGSTKQGNHNLSYSAFNLPTGLSLSSPVADNQGIQGKTTVSPTTANITVKATNEYGASSTEAFSLKVNNYCGDGIKQSPNTEGRGGFYNDGYEDCDIAAGVAFNVASSDVDNQYGCMTTDANTPNPILTNTYCVFKSPSAGGGYCGDGYCQTVINDQPMENCKNCRQDCGDCIATIQSDADQEQMAYFNGQKMYKAVYPDIGTATRTVVTGDNVLGFWLHNNSDYGFAYRILIGPTSTPYDVIDTTNSSLKCAPATAASHSFSGSPSLSDASYDPTGEVVNGGYNWTENGFTETSNFATSTVLSADSRLDQIDYTGQTTGSYLPYIWGSKLSSLSSTAYYCRLIYNLDTMGICHPKCSGKECGADGCSSDTNGCGLCNIKYPGNNSTQMNCSSAGKCVCTPSCSGKECGADGCSSSCGNCSTSHPKYSSGQTSCTDGKCVCTPDCTNKCNGADDGCGGTCSSCRAACYNGACCTPNCNLYNRTCGADGCGGSCGTCASGQSCNSSGQCVCTPNCSSKVCGQDTCGNECGALNGECATGYNCNSSGQCICIPQCSGKVCGSDGCGSSCGTCASGQTCSSGGQCACSQSCGSKTCGQDACGNKCGTLNGACPSGQSCNSSGQCVACTPNCVSKCAGEDNGCNGKCGGNSGCTSSTDVKTCNAFYGTITGFIGNAACKSDCSGYDASACVVNPSSSDWYIAPSETQAYVGRTCIIKLNINTDSTPICNDTSLGSQTAWFKGVIESNMVNYCSVTGCKDVVNPNKCRWFTGAWTNQCYVSSLLP